MNYHKLTLSFICLLLMLCIQLAVSFFILRHSLIILGSIIGIVLCIIAIIYITSKNNQK